MRLKDRVAIVVGAGQSPGEGMGNGRATALTFAREGARVLCVDHHLDSARETVDMIGAKGGAAAAFKADVTKNAELKAMVEDAKRDIEAEFAAALQDRRSDFIIRKVGRTYEILQRGVTKGTGIERFMELPAYRGRKPVYIGDDVHIDDSLVKVTKMEGQLVPVRYMHHENPEQRYDANALCSEDVRKLISLLAKKVPQRV